MHYFSKIKWRLIVAVAVLFQWNITAGEVRVSFLQESNALEDTFEFLTNSGCVDTNAWIFKGIVGLYFSEPFDFKFDKFPNPVDGFYTFYSPQALVAALPHRPCDTDHTYEINCMDTEVLLAAGHLGTGLHPDDLVGLFLASASATNGEVMTLAATARGAFEFTYSSWYRDMMNGIFPPSLRNDRICLSASLFTWHLLPGEMTNEGTSSKLLESKTLEVLRADWQREKVVFPETFEVVALHNVTPSSCTVCTSHAGLLFPRKTGFTFLEKAGGKGPFVRLDIADKSDLLPWLGASSVSSTNTSTNVVRFATFNNSRIVRLRLD